jgi:environmental stress-induced protein Ves
LRKSIDFSVSIAELTLFSGDVETYMKIAASGHDLNIFTRRNSAMAKVSLVSLGKQIQVVDLLTQDLIFYCIEGQAKFVLMDDGEAETVVSGDSLRIWTGSLRSNRELTMSGIPGTTLISVAIELCE